MICYPILTVRALSFWRHHLEGAKEKILIISDSSNLTQFTKRKKHSPRIARWGLELQRYRFDIKYRPGKLNTRADALSRRPDHEAGRESMEDFVVLETDQFIDKELL